MSAVGKNGRAYVHWKAFRETYASLLPSQVLSAHTLEHCMQIAWQGTDHSFIAVQDSQVVGFVGYGPLRDSYAEKIGEIYGLYLLPQYQGRGIGRALLRFAVKALFDQRKIQLWVLQQNQKAICFYENFGFYEIARQKSTAYGGAWLLQMEYYPHATKEI